MTTPATNPMAAPSIAKIGVAGIVPWFVRSVCHPIAAPTTSPTPAPMPAPMAACLTRSFLSLASSRSFAIPTSSIDDDGLAIPTRALLRLTSGAGILIEFRAAMVSPVGIVMLTSGSRLVTPCACPVRERERPPEQDRLLERASERHQGFPPISAADGALGALAFSTVATLIIENIDIHADGTKRLDSRCRSRNDHRHRQTRPDAGSAVR